MTIEGQHAVITGAGRGIGRSISLALAAAGVEVVLASRTKSQLEAVALEIKTLGGIAHVVPTDVSDEIEVEDLAKIAVDACGTIEILVNNAAQFGGGPVADLDVAIWDKVMATNMRGVFLATKAFLPVMTKAGGGSVVMISSTSGKRADAGSSAYAASKYGLIGFSDALRQEVRRDDIRVVVVCPSAVDTGVKDPSLVQQSGRAVRLMGEDIAQAVVDVCQMPPRAMIREFEVWCTNP